MKNFTAFVFLSLAFALSITAQTNAPLKPISGGVLNGKASSLAKPSFPAAARAVQASGSVAVQVLIDEQGNIVSASAVSGHPLLRQASEQAALASKFSPTMLQGQPVKVSGIIVYNFVTDMTFTRIGYDLALIEKSKTAPENIFVGNISANIPKDWEKELSDLQLLDVMTKKPITIQPIPADALRTNSEAPETVVAEQGAIGGRSLRVKDISDPVKIAADLQSNIETRLASDETQLWKFKIGRALGSVAAQIEDDAKTKAEASNINQLLSNAPSIISETTLENLRKLVELIQTSTSADDKNVEILRTVKALRNF